MLIFALIMHILQKTTSKRYNYFNYCNLTSELSENCVACSTVCIVKRQIVS